MINPKGGVGATRRGGWDIYLSFQGSPPATCDGERCGCDVYGDNLPMKRVLEAGWLCRIISGQLPVPLFELEALQEAKNRSCKIIHQ